MFRGKSHDVSPVAVGIVRFCLLPILLVLVCGVGLSGQTPEQTTTPTTPSRPAQHRHARNSIDGRIQVLAKGLDLSVAQQEQLKTILEQRQLQILQIRADSSVSGEARIDLLRALQDQTVDRIRAILTDDQKKRYDPLAVRKVQQQQNSDVDSWLAVTRTR